MAQLTVRNIDSDLVQRLKIRAARHNRSAEAEHRAILEVVLRSVPSDFWERAGELRAAVKGRRHTDSLTLLRQDRDRDHRP
jgi:plasmid stability protein